MNKLSEEEIQSRLSDLDNWDVVDGKLYKEYKFKDFRQAFEFMTKLSVTINKLDHHPDWSNTYNRVFISLVTHSAGGITELDFKLAKVAEQLAKQYS
jgi:4a-hydroxytetrahydrobiopterin dehydratase